MSAHALSCVDYEYCFPDTTSADSNAGDPGSCSGATDGTDGSAGCSGTDSADGGGTAGDSGFTIPSDMGTGHLGGGLTDWTDPFPSLDSGGDTGFTITSDMGTGYLGGDLTNWTDPFAGGGDSFTSPDSVGDPINPATGNVHERQVDYRGGGPFPLRFRRFYNSLNTVPDLVSTEFGIGWRGLYDSAVALLPQSATPTARIVRPDGKSLVFTQNPDGSWRPQDPSVTARLASRSDTAGHVLGWLYTTHADFTEAYDASGRLASITNRAGLTQTLGYDTAGRLTVVRDPSGRELHFAYDAQNHLIRMTDPAGGQYLYVYDAHNNLTAVTYPDGASRIYLYENPAFPNALTGIIDENGDRYASWTYDTQGRATTSQRAGGVQRVILTYNGDGTTTVTDARGMTRVHAFQHLQGKFKIASTTGSCPGCGPLATQVTYDANGFIASRTDLNGNTTTYAYDDRGLLVARTEAAGTAQARTVTFVWHSIFHRPIQISDSDRVVTFDYDARGLLIRRTVSAGILQRTWTYGYDPRGLLTEVTDPRHHVTRLAYDAQGNLASVTNALGQVTRFIGYDATGRVLSMVDRNAVTTAFTYDPLGRLRSRTTAGRAVAYGYDAAGGLIQVTYPDGTAMYRDYDAAHRLMDRTDTLGDTVHYTLNAASDRVKAELFDPNGTLVRSNRFTFDILGRMTGRTDANNETTSLTYDNNGNLVGATDPLGHVTTWGYDHLNRAVARTDAAGGVTSLQYDVHDRLTRVQAPNGATTGYVYDGLGDLLQEISPDRGTTRFTHDSAGNVLTRTDARGITAAYTYDVLNRLRTVRYPEKSGANDPDDDVTFKYDASRDCHFGVGRLCAVEDQSGVTDFDYDTFGNRIRQTEVRHERIHTTRYAFDVLDRLTRMTYPDGRVVDYTLDALGRLAGVAATVNHSRTPVLRDMAYRADGRPLSETFGNGITDTRLYDPEGRVLNQFVGNVDTRVYNYDAAGNLLQLQTVPEVDGYAYDALNRLVRESRTTRGTRTTGFDYDPNGNRASETDAHGVTAYLYSAASNRLVQVGADTLRLDDAGNTISDHNGARTFTYGPAGRLVEVRDGGRPVAVYRYNAWGLRTEKATAHGIVHYHYDQWGRLLGETAEGQPRRDYVWGGSLPVAQIDVGKGTASGSRVEDRQDPRADRGDGELERLSYIETDPSGVPRLATDAKQAVVWRWAGDAFGSSQPTDTNSVSSHDGDEDRLEHRAHQSAVTVNLRFPGQYYDAETGLHNNWMRYYNPNTGRYVTSDPIGLAGGMNTYDYTKGNPLRRRDPRGTDFWDDALNYSDLQQTYVGGPGEQFLNDVGPAFLGADAFVAGGALAVPALAEAAAACVANPAVCNEVGEAAGTGLMTGLTGGQTTPSIPSGETLLEKGRNWLTETGSEWLGEKGSELLNGSGSDGSSHGLPMCY